MRDDTATVEEQARSNCSSERNHLHVPLLHLALHTIIQLRVHVDLDVLLGIIVVTRLGIPKRRDGVHVRDALVVDNVLHWFVHVVLSGVGVSTSGPKSLHPLLYTQANGGIARHPRPLCPLSRVGSPASYRRCPSRDATYTLRQFLLQRQERDSPCTWTEEVSCGTGRGMPPDAYFQRFRRAWPQLQRPHGKTTGMSALGPKMSRNLSSSAKCPFPCVLRPGSDKPAPDTAVLRFILGCSAWSREGDKVRDRRAQLSRLHASRGSSGCPHCAAGSGSRNVASLSRRNRRIPLF